MKANQLLQQAHITVLPGMTSIVTEGIDHFAADYY